MENVIVENDAGMQKETIIEIITSHSAMFTKRIYNCHNFRCYTPPSWRFVQTGTRGGDYWKTGSVEGWVRVRVGQGYATMVLRLAFQDVFPIVCGALSLFACSNRFAATPSSRVCSV